MTTYTNTTRLQHVQIIAVEQNESGVERVTYQVIIGNEKNKLKEFSCTSERFFRNYVLLN